MMDILQPLIDSGKLKKAMDEAGNTLEDFGMLGGWTNNIGNLRTDRGYKVYVTESSTLDIKGDPVSLPLDISLNIGWNIIGFPADQPMDAMAIFQPLIDSGKLIKVMDEAGNTLEDFGFFGGWTNYIGNLSPNKGYKVRMKAAGTLTIPAGGTKLAILPPENITSNHFSKVFIGNGTDHVSINLVDLVKGGLHEGDEIGVFDGKLCVGSARIDAEHLIRNSISIPASWNDGMESRINGFISDNPIILKLFRNNQEYLVKPDLKNNSKGIFVKGESVFATINTSLATAITQSSESVSVKCYPNPFIDKITIEIGNPESQQLKVGIFDLNGKLVRTLYQGTGTEKATMIWDGKNEQGAKMESGSYLIRANNTVEKIVLSH
jgi:hypothetical protein